MGRFIYVNRPFNKIETQLIRDHRFKPLSYDEYDKIRMQFLGIINEKEESFCKRVYKGKKIGPMTPKLMQLSDKNNTMLVLTKGDDEIKAVAGFKIVNKRLYINGVCSNQVTKSLGGDLLVRLVQKVCSITKRNVVTKSRVTRRIFHN
jgi:hypothetical protein